MCKMGTIEKGVRKSERQVSVGGEHVAKASYGSARPETESHLYLRIHHNNISLFDTTDMHPPPAAAAPAESARLEMDDLAEEILQEILSKLAFRDDIAACRLVSRKFCRLATKFHITYAVYADRLSAWTKLEELLADDYYRETVTELVIDASRYLPDMDYDEYLRTSAEAPRIFEPQGIARQQVQDDAAMSALDACLPETPGLAQPNRRTGWMHQHDIKASITERLAIYQQEALLAIQGERRAFRVRLLQKALDRLPNLQSVVLTDYRGLAKDGESYQELCRCLFGDILEVFILSSSYNWIFC